MKDLIEALTILLKYGNPYSPMHCEHDVVTFMINPDHVNVDDIDTLEKLGVHAGKDDYEGMFYSYRFGSA